MASDAVSNRNTAINLRARASDRDLIDRAAQAQGKTRSEFMLEAARERARQFLVDQVFFQFDAKAFKRFERLLDAPVAGQNIVGSGSDVTLVHGAPEPGTLALLGPGVAGLAAKRRRRH
jgi:uncharacterized protein (DUF1778 family)